MNEILAYIAGFIDGEGSISFKLGHKKHIFPYMSIMNTDLETLVWIKTQLSKLGIIVRIWNAGLPAKVHWKQQYMLYISNNKNLLAFLLAIEPYLILKLKNAKTVIEYIKLRNSKKLKSPYSLKEVNLVNRIRKIPLSNLFLDNQLTNL